jgi:hypothetical protein
MTLPETRDLDTRWSDHADREKRNRTVFAQRRLKPADVLPEWERMRAVLGDGKDVERFVAQATGRLGAAMSPRRAGGFGVPVSGLPKPVQERLAGEGVEHDLRASFTQPAAPNCHFVHRSHPLVATLADELLERALAGDATDGQALATLGRIGVWRSAAVDAVTHIVLLRLRHQITITRQGRSHVLLVEEALPVAWRGRAEPHEIHGDELLAWLEAPAAGNLPEGVRQREMQILLESLTQRREDIECIADQQAQRLLDDHRRVREAADARGRYDVHALKPVDIVAAWVLLPEVSA